MNYIVKATRAEWELPGKTVDCYRMPSGEYRFGLTGVSISLGYSKNWLTECLKELADGRPGKLQPLLEEGFTGSVIECQVTERGCGISGASRVKTISLNDYHCLIVWATSKGKLEATELMSALLGKNPVLVSECFKGKSKQKKHREKKVQKNLLRKTNGQMEVPVKTGRIDLLTEGYVIEVKKADLWKQAVGQALVYQSDYPSKKPRIHLYGECSDDFKYMVISYCDRLGVTATFEDPFF